MKVDETASGLQWGIVLPFFLTFFFPSLPSLSLTFFFK